MNNLTIQLTVLLFLGLALSEVHSVIYYLYPNTENIKFDIFLDRSYKQKLNVLWYLYELLGSLNRVIWAYAFTRISFEVSHKLFKVSLVFFGYYILQFLFYIWNRNTIFISNYILYTAMGLTVIELLIPTKEFSKIRNIDSH